MGLFSSIFPRSGAAEEPTVETDANDSVARARSRARQRLLGAVVLVGVAIIGFPLLFETQPRPIPVDVPIEIPARDSVAPLKLPGAAAARNATASAGGAEKSTATVEDKAAAKSETMITESAAEAGSNVASGKSTAATEPAAAGISDRSAERAADKAAETARTADKAEDKPAEKLADKSTDKVADKPAEPALDKTADSRAAEAARARALLEGKVAPKDAAETTRYIVQIGAFADPTLARATRQKVERLGLVTYTHVAKTAEGERTRVRVGPVTSRAEAERIASKIKAAGLPTAILTL